MSSAAQQLRYTYPQLYDESQGLYIKPYEQKLYQDSKSKCSELLNASNISGKDETRCVFEIYNAFDCVRREKVQKSGRFNDTLRLCKYPIQFMMHNLKQEYGDEVKTSLLEEDLKKMKKDRFPYI